MKILLINYNHNIVGGCETMYKYLNRIFPNSELISIKDFEGRDLKEASENLDKTLIERSKKENIFVIKEVEIGGVLDTSKIPQINLFQNPYLQIMNEFNIGYDPWTFEQKKIFGKKVTVSNYMLNGLKQDIEVIPNCVDTEFFKPLDKRNLKINYNIPEGQRIGVWIGSPNQVKNFQMILNLIEHFKDIFWILISKEEFKSPYPNSKVFVKVDNKTVNKLLNCADFFMLTSPIESCGISFFEAMSCNLPCIISKAGYFYDFWDERIGIQINDPNNFKEHKEAIERINTIKTNSRQVIIDRKLDFNSWKTKWEELINGEI